MLDSVNTQQSQTAHRSGNPIGSPNPSGVMILRGHVLTPLAQGSAALPQGQVRWGEAGGVEIKDIPDGAIAIDTATGTIEAVGDYASVRAACAEQAADQVTVRDHRGCFLLPGFVDCHVHFPQLDMVASPGEELLGWLNTYTFPAEQAYADRAFAEAKADVFADAFIAHGVTTASVYATSHPHSAAAMFRAAQARDMRVICGKVCMDRNAPEPLLDTPDTAYADSRALIEAWHGVGRLEYAITPRFAPTSSPAQLDALGELAREFPTVVIQTHLAENRGEVEWVRELYPEAADYTDVYASRGLVRERSILGHSIYLSPSELHRIAEAGAGLAHCPSSNLFLGSGLFDATTAWNAGVRVGLGSDVGAGPSLWAPSVVADAYKVSRLLGTPVNAGQMLYLATLAGAEALGVDAHVGSLEMGKDADVLVVDPAACPALAARLDGGVSGGACSGASGGGVSGGSAEEALFATFLLADERVLREVWVHGRPARAVERG